MDSSGEPPPRSLLARVYLLLCAAYLIWAMWHLIPEHRRQIMRLRLLRSSAQGMSRLARLTGAASMGRELATGEQLYGVPYRLSLARLAAERAYDRARGAV